MRYQADLRTFAFIAAYFGLTAVLWTVPGASILSGHWAIGLPLIVLACWLSFFCAVATHNTLHSPVFVKRPHNRVFQVILTLTYGHPVSAFVPGHNLSHHKHTQTARDVMRTSKVRFRWHLLNGALFLLRVAPGVMRGESAYFKAMKHRLPAWWKQLRIEQIALYSIYGVLLLLDWRKFLLFVFLPHKYAAFGIVTINLLQHDGCDATSEWNHSRNFVGKLVNWFTFNNGFHTIHHLHPALHWSQLPTAHAAEVAPHIHPGLDQPSLLAYLIRTFFWPGKRLRYDGAPYVLAPPIVDESWIPHPEESLDALGAVRES